MLTGKRLPNAQGLLPDIASFRDHDWYFPGKGGQYYREFPPRPDTMQHYDQCKVDINGNKLV